MTNQVTSIEQSKRLLELGVPAEMASMVWDTISLASHPILREWDTSTDTKRWQVDRVGHVPAFTVAHLLGALPSHCRMPDGAWINMEIGKWEDIWCLSYYQMASGSDEVLCGGAGREYYLSVQSTQLINLLYGAVEWLLSKKCKLKI